MKFTEAYFVVLRLSAVRPYCTTGSGMIWETVYAIDTDTVFIMPPFEEKGAFCFALVGWSVGLLVGRYVCR